MTTQSQNSFSEWPIVVGAIIFLGGVAAIAIAKKTGIIEYETATRAAGITMGMILAVFGNFFPKIARPLSDKLNVTAKALAADRASGRIMVFAGLVYTTLWLVPAFSTDWLKLFGPLAVLCVFAVVAINQVWIARADILPFQNGKPKTVAEWKRSGMFIIMHALAWAFAMLLADFIWGDDSRIWMLVVFIVTNGWLSNRAVRSMPTAE